MKYFKIEITFNENGEGHVKSDIELDNYQIKTFQSFPAYYDILILTGYIDGHHLCVKTCSTGNIKLTSDEFEELIYESDYNDIEWLTNHININFFNYEYN